MAGPFTPTPIAGLSAREKDDYYDTPPSCTEALLQREDFPARVWEPACGAGKIAEVLRKTHFTVEATDLVPREYGQPRSVDFLLTTSLLAPAVITNPPFKLADQFVLHAIKLGAQKIAIFQRLTWLEGAERYDTLWKPHPPIRIWAFSKRQTLWRGDDPNPKKTGGTIAFAWHVWERGFTGDPTFGWIR